LRGLGKREMDKESGDQSIRDQEKRYPYPKIVSQNQIDLPAVGRYVSIKHFPASLQSPPQTNSSYASPKNAVFLGEVRRGWGSCTIIPAPLLAAFSLSHSPINQDFENPVPE